MIRRSTSLLLFVSQLALLQGVVRSAYAEPTPKSRAQAAAAPAAGSSGGVQSGSPAAPGASAAGALSASGDSHATAAQTEAAERFERGVELYSDGALEAALVEFERAYELVADHRVLYNVGRVQVERHKYVEAIRAFEQYLREGGSSIAESRRLQVEGDLEKLRGRVANVWIESDVPNAELFLNGVSLGHVPFKGPIAVNPGICEFRLEKAGYRPARQSVKVGGGDSPKITLLLTPLPAPGATPPPPVTDLSPGEARITKNYTPFWVSAATAVVLGGSAGVLGVLSMSRQDDLEGALNDLPSNPAEVDNLRNEGKVFAGVADGLAIGALVATGVGVYFLIAPPERHRPASGVRDVRIGAGPSQLLLSGHF